MKSNTKSEFFLQKISQLNPDDGVFNLFIENLLRSTLEVYPENSVQIQIFNLRKKNLKSYSLNSDKLDFKVLPNGDAAVVKPQSFHSQEMILNNNSVRRLFPLHKDKEGIGFIEVIGKSFSPCLEFSMILAGQLIIRAMISNEKKMAIDSLVELNIELEKIVDEKTDSLLKEKEAHFHASKMATLGEIAAGIAHEINNPLTIIQARILTLEKSMQKKNTLDADTSEGFKKIIDTIQRITKIIRGLKFISRDAQLDEPAKTTLSQLLETTMDLCVEKIKSNDIQLIFVNDKDNYELQVKETQIVQVLLNLIHNSLDAVKILPEKWIKIETTTVRESLLIKIKDSGAGISDEILDKIMNPFFTTKPAGQGTGLGLSISKGIIENHGGKLYYNTNSENTEFIIEIPYIRKIENDKKIVA